MFDIFGVSDFETILSLQNIALPSMAPYFHGSSLTSVASLLYWIFFPGFSSSVQILNYLYSQVFFCVCVPLLSHYKISMNYLFHIYGFQCPMTQILSLIQGIMLSSRFILNTTHIKLK